MARTRRRENNDKDGNGSDSDNVGEYFTPLHPEGSHCPEVGGECVGVTCVYCRTWDNGNKAACSKVQLVAAEAKIAGEDAWGEYRKGNRGRR